MKRAALCVCFLSVAFGGGALAQSSPAGYKGGFSGDLTIGATVSSLGTGVQAGTRIRRNIDARLFGNYLELTHRFTDSGFNLNLKFHMPNAGVKLDVYPLHRIPLRITPGYLFVNHNGIRVDFQAEPGISFTVDNRDWLSDTAKPVHGTGRISLDGTGPMITAGLGHIVSESGRRFTFPFEAGVVFIHTPVVTIEMLGNICEANQTNCRPAMTVPAFASSLARQVASWDQTASAFRVYPIVEGGVAYSFSWRRRVGFE